MVQHDGGGGGINTYNSSPLFTVERKHNSITPAISRERLAVEGTGMRGKQCGVNMHERSSENIDFF